MATNSDLAKRAERAPCPESSCVEPYLNGKLSDAAALAFEHHVETCSRCARALDLRTNPQLQSAPIIPEFEIRGVIGHGGMGTIYRAYDQVMQREIALKVQKASAKDDAELRARFLTEALISGQLDHPNVLPVHDLRTLPDGRPCLVMKLVRGTTLAELLSKRRPDNRDDAEFLDYFERACKAVAYAHALGIIHRDLKPNNIMVEAVHRVSDEDHKDVFVMDWGLAKNLNSLRAQGEESPPGSDSAGDLDRMPTTPSLTRQGLGTVPYMPPEQARGARDLDERADVFSLGAILCEILTGRPPYSSTGARTSAFNHMLAAAESADLELAYDRLAVCGADKDIIDLTTECLQEDRERRPRNAGAVAKRIIAYRAKVRDIPHLAALRDANETSVQIEARIRAEAEAQARREREAREQASKARRQAAKARRRARILAVMVFLLLALVALLGVGLWRLSRGEW